MAMTTKQLGERVRFIVRNLGYPPGQVYRVQVNDDTPDHWKRAVLFDVDVDLDKDGEHGVVEQFRFTMHEYGLGARKFRRIVHRRLCRALERAIERLLPAAAGYKQAVAHLKNLKKLNI